MYGEKQVTITYWVNGIHLSRIVSATRAESWVKLLRQAGASGIQIKRGKTKPKKS